MSLTPKQKLFVELYEGNKTDAARKAGYKGTDGALQSMGRDNMLKPLIINALALRDQFKKPLTEGILRSRKERQQQHQDDSDNQDVNSKRIKVQLDELHKDIKDLRSKAKKATVKETLRLQSLIQSLETKIFIRSAKLADISDKGKIRLGRSCADFVERIQNEDYHVVFTMPEELVCSKCQGVIDV